MITGEHEYVYAAADLILKKCRKLSSAAVIAWLWLGLGVEPDGKATADVAEIATGIGLPLPETRRAIAELERRGLVARTDGRWDLRDLYRHASQME